MTTHLEGCSHLTNTTFHPKGVPGNNFWLCNHSVSSLRLLEYSSRACCHPSTALTLATTLSDGLGQSLFLGTLFFTLLTFLCARAVSFGDCMLSVMFTSALAPS